MNVNEKGNIGLIKVIADLYSKGYHCFTPFDDHCPVDLIALDKAGKSFRIQVKYRSLSEKRNHYEVSAVSIVNGKSKPIDRDLIDTWAVYLSNVDKVVYLPIKLMEGKGVHYIRPEHVENLGTVP
jgi:hypothetical protein